MRQIDSTRRGASKSRLSLVDEAVDAIKDRIDKGVLAPGARINLDETAAELDMSPIPLREAMRVLTTQGLVDSLPLKGYRVRPVTYDDLLETYRLRQVLDPLAVQVAIPNLTDARLVRIETAFTDLSKAPAGVEDWTTRRELHRDFHFAIYEASESRWLLLFIQMLWTNSERYQRLRTAVRSQQVDLKEHREILAACQQRDARRGAQLMKEHIARTARVVAPLLKDKLDGGSSGAD